MAGKGGTAIKLAMAAVEGGVSGVEAVGGRTSSWSELEGSLRLAVVVVKGGVLEERPVRSVAYLLFCE